MRAVLIAVVLAGGCASGTTKVSQDGVDASDGADVDAKVAIDGDVAPVIDAGDVDAAPHPIDAFVQLDACVPQVTELLANPVFDLTPQGTGWTEQPIQNAPGGPFPVITADGLVAHSNPYKVWLGGITSNDVSPPTGSVTDVLFQDVVVPAGTTQLVLTGYFVVGTTEDPAATAAYDHGALDLIQPNGTPIENVLTLSNLSTGLTPGGAWTMFSKTFAMDQSGATVRLRATSTNDFSNVSNFFFDTLSLKATHCP